MSVCSKGHLEGNELAAPVVHHAPDAAHVSAAQDRVDGDQRVVQVRNHLGRVSQYVQVLDLLVVFHLRNIFYKKKTNKKKKKEKKTRLMYIYTGKGLRGCSLSVTITSFRRVDDVFIAPRGVCPLFSLFGFKQKRSAEM